MAITINGSGTLTGISAGGYPDATVTEDDLAATLDLSGKTITLPSGVGGKLLQVVQGSYSINTSFTTNAPTYSSTGLSAAITPSANSSKILVLVDLAFYLGSTTADSAGFGVKIDRTISSTTTDIYTNGGSGYAIYIEQNENDIHMYSRVGYNLLDSPNTTSEATYEVHVARYTTSTTLGVNTAGSKSYITLIEVGA